MGNAPKRDQVRDAFLASQGYRVLRVTNDEVMRNLEGVMVLVMSALAAGPASPSPFTQGNRIWLFASIWIL